MSLPRIVTALLVMVGALVLPLGAAGAEDVPEPTTLTASTADPEVWIDNKVALTARLATNAGPLAGEPVRLERLAGGSWSVVAQGTSSATGAFTASVTVPEVGNRYRAVYDGAPTYSPAVSGEVLVTGLKHSPQLVIGGATTVIDEHATSISATWRTGSGRPVAGATVRLLELPQGASQWRVLASTTLHADGLGWFTIRPRVDTRYRLQGLPGRWWNADVSGDRFVDNLPPGRPWRDPAGSPRPKSLPAQPRAWGAGANVLVTRIPDNVWNQMTGISWHSGCPVGRSGLRQIATNYWGFDGYRHRGGLIVNASITGKYVGALRDLYAARIPVRAMYRVDRFGYSSRSGGGDDFASMAHDNTSAFNCRWVTGNPGVRSPHSTGRSWDINTWENPYRSKIGWLPNTWWPARSDARVAWRSGDHQVVRILRANGFSWTYGTSDAQHYDGREAGTRGGWFSG